MLLDYCRPQIACHRVESILLDSKSSRSDSNRYSAPTSAADYVSAYASREHVVPPNRISASLTRLVQRLCSGKLQTTARIPATMQRSSAISTAIN